MFVLNSILCDSFHTISGVHCRHTDRQTQVTGWKEDFMTFCDFKCFCRRNLKMPMRLQFKKLFPYTPLFSPFFQNFLPFYFIGKLWWWLLLHLLTRSYPWDNVLVHFLWGAPPAAQKALHEKRCSPDLPVYYSATFDNLLDFGRTFSGLCWVWLLFGLLLWVGSNFCCWNLWRYFFTVLVIVNVSCLNKF